MYSFERTNNEYKLGLTGALEAKAAAFSRARCYFVPIDYTCCGDCAQCEACTLILGRQTAAVVSWVKECEGI